MHEEPELYAAPTPAGGGPLAGVRILDFTTFLSGPYGSQLLADLGAEDIKLESPVGDLSRRIPPHFVRGDSLYFHTINRNKSSVVIDLKHDDAPGLVSDLIGTVDVVFENFRPGVMERLGIVATEELERRPRLIWCSITGFGQSGPYRAFPAYDMVVQALSGSMSITGEPGGPAVRTGIPLGDLAAGLHAVTAVLAALHRRSVAGHGEHIDISMLDCLVSMLSYQGTYYLQSGVVPGRQGRAHDSIPTYRAFTASDGRDVVVTANTEQMWRSLCRVLGVTELLDDERFATNADRLENREALLSRLEPAFERRTAREWVGELTAHGVPAALVNDLAEVFADPQVGHRRLVLDLEEGDDRVRVPASPFVFARSARSSHRFPPQLGHDTLDVLRESLGVSAETLQRWRETGLLPL